MLLRSIKVSEESYKRLSSIAGKLQEVEGHPVSVDKALQTILRKPRYGKPSDFAGGWKMSDKEAREISRDVERHWKAWEKKL